MKNLKLVIGNKNYSSWSLRPWLFLKHFKIPFEEINISLNTENTSRDIAKYSAAGRVPALKDGEFAVWDSSAILEYLNENYAEGEGLPQNIEERAEARAVSAEMHAGFMDLRREMPLNCRTIYQDFKVTAGAIKDIERITEIWRSCRNRFKDNGPWLFGKFSIADCMYAPVVLRFITYGTEVDQDTKEYMRTIVNHPAIQEWVEASINEEQVIDEEEFSHPSLRQSLS